MYRLSEDDKTERQKDISDISVQNRRIFSVPIEKKEIQKYVVEYFSEHGYSKAFHALKREAGIEHTAAPLLEEREEIRILSSEGKALEIISKIEKILPCLFAEHPELVFAILEQDILEDLCIRNNSEGAALDRIEKELSPIVIEHSEILGNLEEIVASVIFSKVSSEAVISRRDALFARINKAILLYMDYMMSCSLNKLLNELSQVSKQPEFINLMKTCGLLQKVMKEAGI